MEKDEILMKAQEENKGKDVADLDAQRKGAYIAYFVGLFLIIIWDVVEGIRFHHINYGGNMALCAMASTAFSVKYVNLKKRHELFVALVYGLAAVTFLVLWILQLIGVMPR
jgi:hypothetical protein